VVVTGYAEVIGPHLHYAYDLPDVRTDWAVGTVRRLIYDHRIVDTDGESTWLAPGDVLADEVIDCTQPEADLMYRLTYRRNRRLNGSPGFVYLADLIPTAHGVARPRPGFRSRVATGDDE
jgi:hypothetical protein